MNKYNWKIDIKEIKALYEKGFSCTQVGLALGCSRQSIWERLKKSKTETRKNKVLPYIIYDNKKWTVLKSTGYYRLTTSRKKHISLHRYVWEQNNGSIPSGFDIHHIDNNKQNNDIKNLECLSKSEHTKKYSPHHNQYKNNKTLCKESNQ
jgi:hypothetical protein